jgi:hypothetical protein
MTLAFVRSAYGGEVVVNTTEEMAASWPTTARRAASTAIDVASSSNDATARVPRPMPAATRSSRRCGM